MDGRRLDEAREVVVKVRRASGSHSLAEVSVGGTRAVCDVSAEIMTPYGAAPNEGNLQMHVSMAPVASPRAAGAGGTRAPALALLERSLLSSRAVDLESLCIVAGAKAWNVKCVVTVTDDCGAALDAASLAAMAALLHFRRPDVTCVGDQVTVHTLEERAPVPLSIHHVPLCVSLALLRDEEAELDAVRGGAGGGGGDDDDNDDGDAADGRDDRPGPRVERDDPDSDAGLVALVDPTHREEAVADGLVSVSLNAHKEVCGLAKTGQPPLSSRALASLVARAVKVRAARTRVLERALVESPFGV